MRRAVRALYQTGVRQVIWPQNCPWSLQEAGFVGIEVEALYQAQADQLALGALEGLGIPLGEGRIALVGQRLTIPLQRTAQRLCPQVKGLLIQVPGAGEDYARWLHGQYGLPVAPAAAGAEVTVAFPPAAPDGDGAWRCTGIAAWTACASLPRGSTCRRRWKSRCWRCCGSVGKSGGRRLWLHSSEV